MKKSHTFPLSNRGRVYVHYYTRDEKISLHVRDNEEEEEEVEGPPKFILCNQAYKLTEVS